LFKGSKKVIDNHVFVLEGFLLYAAVGVPLILGMLVCRGRSGFARICIVAFAIIIVSVGIASVYVAIRDEPWVYVSQHTGQYINLLGGMFLLGTIVGAIWALPSKQTAALDGEEETAHEP
jgi:hypothetical protein